MKSYTPGSLRNENAVLDAVDVAILKALADDARTPVAQLARSIGMSPPSINERIRRLEDAGIIEGYSLRINPAALGLPIAAWVRIRPTPGKLQIVAEAVRGIPEVIECHRVTGEDCFVARVHVASIDALEKLIDRIVPYATTHTSIVQSSPVPLRLPPIE